MGAATGLVVGLEALANGAVATDCGAVRSSTGLAGGPLPTNFSCVSTGKGLCEEDGGPLKTLTSVHRDLLSVQEMPQGC